jgi:hypothetical protein
MEPAEPKPRPYTLQRAAVVVFAFVSILPLLLYIDTLYTLGALGRAKVLVNLGLGLGAILIGFYLFWTMTGRMAEILRAAQEHQDTALPGRASLEADFHMPVFGAIREIEPIRETDMMDDGGRGGAAASGVGSRGAAPSRAPRGHLSAQRPPAHRGHAQPDHRERPPPA